MLRGDELLRNPTNAELADGSGHFRPVASYRRRRLRPARRRRGPRRAGRLPFTARPRGLTRWPIDAVAAGGQAGTSTRIENYLGFPAGHLGHGAGRARQRVQAGKFGARLRVPSEATGFEPAAEGGYTVQLDDGSDAARAQHRDRDGARYRSLEYRTARRAGRPGRLLLGGLHGGGHVRRLGRGDRWRRQLGWAGRDVPVEDRCEGDDHRPSRRPRRDDVPLSDRSDRAHRQHRGSRPRRRWPRWPASARSRESSSRIAEPASARLSRLPRSSCSSAPTRGRRGSPRLRRARLEGLRSHRPGRASGRRPVPATLETNLAGVYAVGDVRSGSTKRVASAVGEGSMAVRLVHEHLGAG